MTAIIPTGTVEVIPPTEAARTYFNIQHFYCLVSKPAPLKHSELKRHITLGFSHELSKLIISKNCAWIKGQQIQPPLRLGSLQPNQEQNNALHQKFTYYNIQIITCQK